MILPGGVAVWAAAAAGAVLAAGPLILWRNASVSALELMHQAHLTADAQAALTAEQESRRREREAQATADDLRGQPVTARVFCQSAPADPAVPAAGDGQSRQPVPDGLAGADVTAAVRELVAAAAANNGLADAIASRNP